MSRRQRAASGFLTSLAFLGLQLASSALLSPLILRFAGREALGAYSVLLQGIAYLTLLDLGFGVAFGRALAQAHGAPDSDERSRTIASTALAFYTVLNCLVGLIALGASLRPDGFLGVEPGGDIAEQVRKSLQLFALWTILRIPLSVYGPALVARQQLAAANRAQMAGVVVRFVASITLTVAGGGLVALLLAQCLGELVTNGLQAWRYRQVFPKGAPSWRHADPRLLRSLLGFGTQQMLTSVATRLVYSTDQIIVGRVNGLSAAAVYYTTQMPGFVLIQAIWTLTDNSAPALNELHGRGETSRVRESLLRVFKYSLLLASGAALGIFLFNRVIVTAWVGAAQYAGTLMTTALAVFALFSIANHAFAIALLVFGEVRVLARSAFALGLLNVVSSVPLAHRFGPGGVMLASAVTEAMLAIVLGGAVLRSAGLDVRALAAGVARPFARLSLVLIVVATAIALLPSSHSLSRAAGEAAIFVAAWVAGTWYLALAGSERAELRATFTRLLGRKGATA